MSEFTPYERKLMDEITALEKKLEQAEARCAEHEEEMAMLMSVAELICQQESAEWDSDALQTHKDYAEVCGQRIGRLSPINAKAWLLRKNAEALTSVADSIGEGVYQRIAKSRLRATSATFRQQATEIERGAS